MGTLRHAKVELLDGLRIRVGGGSGRTSQPEHSLDSRVRFAGHVGLTMTTGPARHPPQPLIPGGAVSKGERNKLPARRSHGSMSHGRIHPPEDYLPRDARRRCARPVDLLLGLPLQPLDRDLRRSMAG
jgi:hypothetical protein